ncbi:MAG: cupin domain-containing protein [Chloroflexi bacterium]|nr:cupin domain-containing protein [Chloroflexota bacterium]
MDAKSKVEAGEAKDGHVHEPEVKWERWDKDRFFVRALVGKYGEVYKKLLDQPRVYKSKDFKPKGGPGQYSRSIINPHNLEITQMIETHIEVYAPGGYTQKHGHMNSAVFYILDGKGYDIHDGQRYDFEAGDVCIVENACVHRHYNADPEKPAAVLVMKAKPLFLFAHMLYQKMVEYPLDTLPPGVWFDPVTYTGGVDDAVR